MGPAGLTAVFGMGTGGTPPVSSPEFARPGINPGGRGGSLPIRLSVAHAGWRRREIHPGVGPDGSGIATLRDGDSWPEPRGPDRFGAATSRGGQAARLLGPVGCDGRPSCTPGLSTWSSSRSLRSIRCRKPHLGGGFALRCLQRLSCPDLATRRCPERDSRHTRGRSSPILSY